MTVPEILAYLNDVDPTLLCIVDYGRSYVGNSNPFPRTGAFEGTGAYQCRPKEPTRAVTGVDGSELLLSRVSDFYTVDLVKQGTRWVDPTPMDEREFPTIARSLRIVEKAMRRKHGAVIADGYVTF